MELSFVTCITFWFVNAGSEASFADNFNMICAIILGFLTMVFPAFLLIFYCYNFKRMSDPDD